jgi:integrase
MSIRFDEKRKRYRVCVGSGTKRKYKDLKSKKEALIWEAQQKCIHEEGNFERFDYPLSNLLIEYLQTLDNCVQNHQDDVKQTINKLFEEYGLRELRDLKPSVLEKFKIDCEQALTTKNRKIGFVKSLTNFAFKQGYVNSDPLKWVSKVKQRKKDIKEKRALSQDELLKIFSATEKMKPELLPVLIFFANTGCRLSELVTLEWGNFDFSKRLIRFTDKPHIMIRNEPFTCKWGSQRVMPMKKIIVDYLCDLPRVNNWVFLPKQGRNNLGYYIYKNLKKIVKSTTIERNENIAIHTFRHTWISQMLASGVSLPEVSSLAGHSNLTTTQGYAHLLGNFSSLETSMNLMPDLGMKCAKNTPLNNIEEFKSA